VSADPRTSLDAKHVLARLAATMAERKGADPASSYVAKLFSKAPDGALKKVGEEAAEFIMACKDAEHEPEAKSKMVSEAADVWFHMLVAMARHDLDGTDVLNELARREGMSGLDEKAARQK
jgi:phosphoribosyl-ATP pyrophosphohydrolase